MERRLTALIAATIAMMALAVLWSVFVRHRVPAESTMTPPVAAAHDTTPPPASPPAPPAGTTTTSQGVGADTGGLSYMDALARSETRRRVRASAGVTYLNEIVAASQDSMLHRWTTAGGILCASTSHRGPSPTSSRASSTLSAAPSPSGGAPACQ